MCLRCLGPGSPLKAEMSFKGEGRLPVWPGGGACATPERKGKRRLTRFCPLVFRWSKLKGFRRQKSTRQTLQITISGGCEIPLYFTRQIRVLDQEFPP